jgi:hypothetical protein
MTWNELAQRTQRVNPSYRGLYAAPKVSSAKPSVRKYAGRRDVYPVVHNPQHASNSVRNVYRSYDDVRDHAIGGDENAARLLTNLALSV